MKKKTLIWIIVVAALVAAATTVIILINTDVPYQELTCEDPDSELPPPPKSDFSNYDFEEEGEVCTGNCAECERQCGASANLQ